MNCHETRTLLAAYLDHELGDPQHARVQDHLSGCAACQAELAALSSARTQVAALLHRALDSAAPRPDAWPRLQAALAEVAAAQPPELAVVPSPDGAQPRRRPASRRPAADPTGEHESMRKPSLVNALSLAFVTLAVLVFIGLVIVRPLLGVPTGPAAGDDPTGAPGEEGESPMPTATSTPLPVGFTPLSPLVLPGDLPLLSAEFSADGLQHVTVFADDARATFLILTQTPVTPDAPQPSGVPISVFPGFLETDLSGTAQVGDTAIPYTGGFRLTWDVQNVRLSALTNLPAADVYPFASAVALTFSPYRPTWQPADLYASQGVLAVEWGALVSEDRFYGNDRFVVITQRLLTPGEALPEGEVVAGADRTAVLIGRQSGTVHLNDETEFQDNTPRYVIGMGGGGGGSSDSEPQTHPAALDYTDGWRLVWHAGNVRVEMLANLSQEELIQVFESLVPTDPPSLARGPQGPGADQPVGGAYLGYRAELSELPADFYANVVVNAFDADRLAMTETRHYGNERFVILTAYQSLGDPLPGGEPVSIGAYPGVLSAGQSGTALLDIQTYQTFQDGQPRWMFGGGGGGGGSFDFELLFPKDLPFQDGILLTWDQDGARITLLTNLPREEALSAASTVRVTPVYFVVHPENGGAQEAVGLDFRPYGPTYLPPDMNGFSGASTETGGLELIYMGHRDADTRFYVLFQRAAQPGDALPAGESFLLNGLYPAVIERGLAGAYPLFERFGVELPGGPDLAYADAIRITWIADGVWLEALVADVEEEARRFAERLLPAH